MFEGHWKVPLGADGGERFAGQSVVSKGGTMSC